jgi:membrane fusion protein (multidrug efflux system)
MAAQDTQQDDQHDPAQEHDESEDGKNQENGDQKKEDGTPEEQKPHSKKPLIILAIVIAVMLVAGFIYWLATHNLESTDDAYTEGNTVTIAPKVSGYVVALYIDDNTFVHAGDLLLKIDPRDYIATRDQAAAQLAIAKAQLESAEINYEIAKVQYPAKLTQAQAQTVSAEANAKQAIAQAERQRAVDVRATTLNNIDTATAQARSATSQVTYNEAEVAVAKLVPQNIKAAAAQVDQLQAQVAAAKAQLDAAELNVSYTELRAPQDGWVARRNVQLGSFLQAGQSLFSLVTTDVWVVANFKESQLDRMRPNQKVTIAVDAYPSLKLKGHVQSVQMGSGSRFSAFPAENATGNFIKIVQRVPVKIVIDSGLDPNIPLPLGLSVDPTVDLTSGPDSKAGQSARKHA